MEASTSPCKIYSQLGHFRELFQTVGLANYYAGPFRMENLRRSLSLAPAAHFSGKVLDVGADDNLTGAILEDYSDIETVTGVDVVKREYVYSSQRTRFLLQVQPAIIPLPSGVFGTALCRYSLHHMPRPIQLRILGEISRCLRPGGTLIIWENSISATLPPEQCFDPQILARITMLDRDECKALFSAMDVISFAIKEKPQPFPFSFRSLEAWQTLLARGWRVLSVRYVGLPLIDLHQTPLGILVLEKP